MGGMFGLFTKHTAFLKSGVIEIIFYDFEVFKEDWLAVFIDVNEEKEYVIVNDPDKLKALYDIGYKEGLEHISGIETFLNR